MTSLRESHALRTWALVLVLVVFAVAGGERLVDTLADNEETVAWAHTTRLVASADGRATPRKPPTGPVSPSPIGP